MKYYYTDPLAAAWMAKHFRMRFQSGKLFLSISLENVPPEAAVMVSKVEPLYIHPHSLHLLEPQVGDLVFQNWMYSYFIISDNTPKIAYENIDKIIQRNGIAFMWPEMELT